MSYVDPAKSKLFRQEALDARRDRFQGSVLLTFPISSWLISAFAIAVFILIAAIVVFCSYTRRVTVSGQVTPSLGVLRVYPAQAGIVVEKRVVEGQHVRAGDVLYVLSSDRYSSAMGGTQVEVSNQISYRRASLESELENARRLQTEEAVRQVIVQGFDILKLVRIETTVFSWNAASARVLTKCGFEHEGRLRMSFNKSGEIADRDVFALLCPQNLGHHSV